MKIHGLGTEIVEVLRIAKMIERHAEEFLNRVFTPRELTFCQNRSQTTQHYAAIWAAKQAIARAVGLRWQRTLHWSDMEIRPVANGGAKVKFRGSMRDALEQLPIGEIRVTMAHCRSHATATAIVLEREANA